MRLLAIDPGEKFGWATADIYEDCGGFATNATATGNYKFEVGTHGITPAKDFIVKFFEVAANYDVVVLERYRIAAGKLKEHTGSDVPTLQYIGAVRAACWLHPQVKLVMQTPQNMTTARSSMPNWLREKINGLPKAHDDSHDGSALLHAWFFYWKRYV